MANYVRVLSRESVLKPDGDLLKNSRLFTLGDVHHGAGDPAGLAVAPSDAMVVAQHVADVVQQRCGDERVGAS